MHSRREILVRGAQAGAAWAMAGVVKVIGQGPTMKLQEATAITRVFGEGQKLIAVALQHSSAVDGARLAEQDFKVEGRKITRAYASHSAVPGRAETSGHFVLLELSPDDAGALLISSPGGAGPGGRPGGAAGGAPGGPGGGPPNEGGPVGPGEPPNRGGPGAGSGPRALPSPPLRVASASVSQVKQITCTDRKVIAASSAMSTSHVLNLVVDEFKQRTFAPAGGGAPLRYNLFVPHGYNKNKKYPLVLFVHDAGTLSSNPLVTLAQGLGAVVWATPEEQAKRECFVLAPQVQQRGGRRKERTRITNGYARRPHSFAGQGV